MDALTDTWLERVEMTELERQIYAAAYAHTMLDQWERSLDIANSSRYASGQAWLVVRTRRLEAYAAACELLTEPLLDGPVADVDKITGAELRHVSTHESLPDLVSVQLVEIAGQLESTGMTIEHDEVIQRHARARTSWPTPS